MSHHRGEPAKTTGEIPVSLNLLSVVNRLAITYLSVKGLFYVLTGLTWLIFQSPSRAAGIAWVDFLTPQGVGVVWISSGLISIIVSFLKNPRAHRIGYVLLIATPTLVGLYFLISWLIYVTPWVEAPGYERGLATTVSCGAFAASAYLFARVYTFSQGGLIVAGRGRR